MLDREILNQLTEHFSQLKHQVTLRIHKSSHNDQAGLLDMVRELTSTSQKISLELAEDFSEVPHLTLLSDKNPTGITFIGIPGGHEFTSLVVAILNAGGLGKLPDEGIQKRIRKLKPGAIKTFISLTCENCPDVVQALNQIAIIHGQIEHHTIDGALVQEKLEQLGIQGVPSITIQDQLIHSGRAGLTEIIEKLEHSLGVKESTSSTPSEHLGHFDLTVIGGGPAGASSAIYTARKGLKVAVIAEKIGGQVTETKGIENFTSVSYTEGPQLSSNFAKHLEQYPIKIYEHRRVIDLKKNGAIHEITLNSGETLTASSIIIATGAKWRELGVPGEKEYLGRGVAFCPHCDGPFYAGKPVAVVGGGNSGVEAAIDLAGICSFVTLIEYADKLRADEVLIKKLYSLKNVRVIVNAKTLGIHGNGAKVSSLEYEDRSTQLKQKVELDGVFVQIGLIPNSAPFKSLVQVNTANEIIVDEKGRTSSPGIYAAGDVTTTPYKQIVIAMGEGAKVALTAFEDRMRAAS